MLAIGELLKQSAADDATGVVQFGNIVVAQLDITTGFNGDIYQRCFCALAAEKQSDENV